MIVQSEIQKQKKAGKEEPQTTKTAHTHTHTHSLFCFNRFGNEKGEFQIFVSQHHLRQTTTTMLQQQ